MWSRKEEAVLLIIHPYTQKWLRNRGLRQSTPTNKWFTQGKRAVRPTGPAYTSFKLSVQRHYIGMFPISNKIQENRKPHTQSEVTNLNQPPLSVSIKIATGCFRVLVMAVIICQIKLLQKRGFQRDFVRVRHVFLHFSLGVIMLIINN